MPNCNKKSFGKTSHQNQGTQIIKQFIEEERNQLKKTVLTHQQDIGESDIETRPPLDSNPRTKDNEEIDLARRLHKVESFQIQKMEEFLVEIDHHFDKTKGDCKSFS
jgi:hypothetical protein